MKKNDLRTIVEQLRGFDTAMLVTRRDDGELHARPMAVAEVDDHARLVFATTRRSAAFEEIAGDAHVVVTMQTKERYAVVGGAAAFDDDRHRIHALWRPEWSAWFPEGEGDPDLVLVTVEPHLCELWDVGGTTGLRNVGSMARAVVKGGRAQDQQGYREDHVVVRP